MVPFLVSSHTVTTLCRNFYLEGMLPSVRVSTMQCLLWKWGWSWLVSVWHSIWVAVYTKVTLWVLKPNHFFTGGLARKESLFSFWYILGTLPGPGFLCGHSIIVSLLFPPWTSHYKRFLIGLWKKFSNTEHLILLGKEELSGLWLPGDSNWVYHLSSFLK